VVYLGSHSHDSSEMSSFDFNSVTNSHYEFLGSFLGRYYNSKLYNILNYLCFANWNDWVLFICSSETAKESIFYSYTRHINGFAANLEEKVAAEIASKS
jgi:hypothetical protein